MNEHESLLAAIHEDVSLQAHDAAWPLQFAKEQQRLCALLPGVFLGVEHIGSTAVSGLAAKPIIDILAGVASMDVARAISGPLCDSGYTTSAEFNASLSNRQWFMRWSRGRRTHHLHVVVHGGEAWLEWLWFRDALRQDSNLAAQYAELKARLAVAHATDREAYTLAKADFIRLAVGGLNRGPSSARN
jgi:GrpB-like predicted nucleotidyltransferase (UPF0157 family)